MKVMLDIFSGRPNPTWKLTKKEAREFADRAAGKRVMQYPEDALILGFRGFIVEGELEDGPQQLGVPPRFRIASPQEEVVPTMKSLAAAQDGRSRLEETEAGLWLLETSKGVVEDNVLNFVRESLKEGPQLPPPRAQEVAAANPVSPRTLREANPNCQPFLTSYRPFFWNYRPIRLRNNCYNYAINFVSNTVGQPGRYAGEMYTVFQCDSVGHAAIADGCVSECESVVRVVALVIWPDFDFHWYRLHPEGFWAHKLGIFSARNIDNQGRVIGGDLTPENCDRGPYTTFCRYYYAPSDMRVL